MLHAAILEALEGALQTAIKAAQQAHEAATHEESAAETKWDTMGLEASYLAEGQSRRVEECQEAITLFNQLVVKPFDEDSPISLGAMVELLNTESVSSMVFLSPTSGGLKINLEAVEIMLVTPQAPLGKSLMGAFYGDEIKVGDAVYSIEHVE